MSDTSATPAEATTSSDQVAPDEVSIKLAELGIDADTIEKVKNVLGVLTLSDLAEVDKGDLLSVGMNTVQASKVQKLGVTIAHVPDATAFGAMALDLLPAVPDDASWLMALRAGGVLKVDQSTVISAIRAALASRVGLYDITEKLAALMEKFADTNDEPVSEDFWPLLDQLTRRSYGDIFSAIPGLNGRFVTATRKKELFRRIDEHLWPAIIGFGGLLKAWWPEYVQYANPLNQLGSALGAALGGGAQAITPGVAIMPPDTSGLRDSADAVNDAVNRVFAGTGTQIAAALAYEATEIRKTLENSRLPAMVGAANREQMLKMLNAAVSPSYPRLEVNLTRFVLGIMRAGDQPAGVEELQYFGALAQLSTQITWDQLGNEGHKISGIGGSRL